MGQDCKLLRRELRRRRGKLNARISSTFPDPLCAIIIDYCLASRQAITAIESVGYCREFIELGNIQIMIDWMGSGCCIEWTTPLPPHMISMHAHDRTWTLSWYCPARELLNIYVGEPKAHWYDSRYKEAMMECVDTIRARIYKITAEFTPDPELSPS